ncbi:MAG: Gamma-glutamyltranspeptidase [Gammaproteobacteria bacterium]|nr:MAG: Gamma-glutamyltranspeptidase [Gammaproteobacteria bacterium]
MPNPPRGAVAAGHRLTADAATEVLAAGGNAFDALISALWTACVVEPVLCSPGGGGFLMARPEGRQAAVLDFFVQTPRRRRPVDELDFHEVIADFGTDQQAFHIGLGSIATPGFVRGLFEMQRRLGSMPMRELVAPAVQHAREGVALDALQAYIFSIVAPIYLATDEARAVFESPSRPGHTLQAGEILRQPELAETLEILAIEGDDLFYRGEIAALIEQQCLEGGGQIGREDLARYETAERGALRAGMGDHALWTNPPPSSGGILIAFALRLLDSLPDGWLPASGPRRAVRIARLLDITNKARIEHHVDVPTADVQEEYALLDPQLIARYREELLGAPQAMRGTTHVSVVDGQGNLAAATVSNGEGCGHLVPGTGIMLNNMLGEEDLNPHGFHRWQPDRRMTSMMAPGILRLASGAEVVLGSGGSNRIRSALLQVILHLADGADLQAAVDAPRLHVEGQQLSIEGGFDADSIEALQAAWPEHVLWQERNLFFGGVHAVMREPGGGLVAVGDPRRAGEARVV